MVEKIVWSPGKMFPVFSVKILRVFDRNFRNFQNGMVDLRIQKKTSFDPHKHVNFPFLECIEKLDMFKFKLSLHQSAGHQLRASELNEQRLLDCSRQK